MNEKETSLTFDEFRELCEEAGIYTDNEEVLEQDYRSGKALADVTDALISDQEVHPASYTAGEALDNMDIAVSLLEEGQDLEANRKAAIKLAVSAIRYVAECCHDEGKN